MPEVSVKFHRGLCIPVHNRVGGILVLSVSVCVAFELFAQEIIINEIGPGPLPGSGAPQVLVKVIKSSGPKIIIREIKAAAAQPPVAPVSGHPVKKIIIKVIKLKMISGAAKPGKKVHVVKTSNPKVVITEIATIKKNELPPTATSSPPCMEGGRKR